MLMRKHYVVLCTDIDNHLNQLSYTYLRNFIFLITENRMKCKRVRWNNKEKNIVLKEFNTYLNTHKCPTNKEIAALIAANPLLQTRTISQIKTWLNNQQKISRVKS